MINPQVVISAREKLGEYLRSTREEKKLSLKYVAEKSGLTEQQIQSI